MHSLFVDSTAGLVVGLLDPEFKWVEYLELDGKKPSEIVHDEIFKLLSRHHLKMSELNFFFSAGPGSYTGMRLGEGMAQVLEWTLRPTFSFCHFDVPKLAGVERGTWVTNGFKGQVFIYQWDLSSGLSETKLLNSADFNLEDRESCYTLSSAPESKEFVGLKTTKDLIKNSPGIIFSQVLAKKLREPPYYFRSLEEEFK